MNLSIRTWKALTIFVLFLTCLKLGYNYLVYPSAWLGYSYDIEYSKKINAFEELFVVDSMTVYRESEKKIMGELVNADLWKERQWHRAPILIWFHPVQLMNRSNIVLKSKLLSRKSNERVYISSYPAGIRSYHDDAVEIHFRSDTVPNRFELGFKKELADSQEIGKLFISVKEE